jgi:hypothetical protein
MTMFLTHPDTRIPASQKMIFAEAPESEWPPYLLGYQGSPAERLVENIKVKSPQCLWNVTTFDDVCLRIFRFSENWEERHTKLHQLEIVMSDCGRRSNISTIAWWVLMSIGQD